MTNLTTNIPNPEWRPYPFCIDNSDTVKVTSKSSQPGEGNKREKKITIITFSNGVLFSLTNETYGDPYFLTEISACQPLRMEHVGIDWRHSLKATAQSILPFLYLGPLSVSRNSDFLRKEGITMLLAVRDGRAAQVNPKVMDVRQFATSQGIEGVLFDVFDELDMTRRFPSVIRQMVDHLKARTANRPVKGLDMVGGRILVFCETGDGRSAAVVILFFMVVFGLSSSDAMRAIQARRFSIHMNEAFQRMVNGRDDILQAEKQVIEAFGEEWSQRGKHVGEPLKRNIDNVCGEDEHMDDVVQGMECKRHETAHPRTRI